MIFGYFSNFSFGKKRPVLLTYTKYASPNLSIESASSRFANLTYITTKTGNMTKVKIVGHCRRNPNIIAMNAIEHLLTFVNCLRLIHDAVTSMSRQYRRSVPG